MKPFIRLETTLEKAMQYKSSPEDQFLYFGGVQLLPNSNYPYIQTTQSDEGVELEDYDEINILSICGKVLGNIADYFFVIDNFQDPDTGLPQITWKISENLPETFDFGKQLVYIQAKQMAGQVFYSSPFMLTSDEGEFTARIDYREKESDIMQSVQVCLFYSESEVLKEYSQYWETSTKLTRNNTIKSQMTEVWKTPVINKDLIIDIINVFDNKYCFLDLKKAIIFQSPEISRKEGFENFNNAEFIFSIDGRSMYDPNYLPPVPLPPDPDPEDLPNIEITFIFRGPNYGLGVYDVLFVSNNFDPSYMAMETSRNGESWIQTMGNTEITRNVNFSNIYGSVTAGTYFRIRMFHEGLGLYSNMANICVGQYLYGIIQKKISETQYLFDIYFNTPGAMQSINLKITTSGSELDYIKNNTGYISQIVDVTTGQVVTFEISNPGYTSSMTIIAQTNN